MDIKFCWGLQDGPAHGGAFAPAKVFDPGPGKIFWPRPRKVFWPRRRQGGAPAGAEPCWGLPRAPEFLG